MKNVVQKTVAQQFITNPFVIESPEKLTQEQIFALFVEPYTPIETLKQRRHTFVWGSRGSGKSMLLRYLEPKCQTLRHGGISNFLRDPGSFLAVYCPCKEGHINKGELNLLNERSAGIITEHLLNLNVTDRLINILLCQFPANYFKAPLCVKFTKSVFQLFERASIASSIGYADSKANQKKQPLQWLQSLVFAENCKIASYLRNNVLRGGGVIYEGATSGYHDFLLPLMAATQALLEKSIPIYLLIDDADRLPVQQQRILNTWIANRDQSKLCVKISSQRDDYETFLTRDGGLIEEFHDYSAIDVEELYTRAKSDYFKKVKLVVEKRLALSLIPTKQIEKLFPANPTEESSFEEIKKQTAAEWGQVGKPGSQKDYVTRYAVARFFQSLAAKKQPKSYAGFQNIVHLSSGIIRNFLDPCYLMLDACISKGAEIKSIKEIPPTIQDEILLLHSKNFLAMCMYLKKDLPPEEWEQIHSLKILLESLGEFFYMRLHDPKAREPRLFSFTVHGTVPPDIKKVLQLGIRYRYFQLRTYSQKKGGGREDWYILNRRLCPIFKLDPTAFEGRLSLTPEDLALACKNTKDFLKKRFKSTEIDSQPTLF